MATVLESTASIESEPAVAQTETKAIRPLDLTTQLEERELVNQEKQKSIFKVLSINSSELWLPAIEHSSEYDLKVRNSSNVKRFTLKGVCFSELENSEAEFQLPESAEDEDDTADYNKQKAITLQKRKVKLLEHSSGFIIPGNSLDDKVRWLELRAQGEVDTLFNYVSDVMGNFYDNPILSEFTSLALRQATNIISVSDFSQWEEAANTETVFRMARPFEKYIIEFPLKSISTKDKQEIDEQTKEPIPPKLPRRDKETGRIDPTRLEPNYRDPHYKERLRVINQKRFAMVIQAALMFDIPGGNWEQKYQWISQRIVGDVIRLRNFIDEEILGYKSRYDFFT